MHTNTREQMRFEFRKRQTDSLSESAIFGAGFEEQKPESQQPRRVASQNLKIYNASRADDRLLALAEARVAIWLQIRQRSEEALAFSQEDCHSPRCTRHLRRRCFARELRTNTLPVFSREHAEQQVF